ncbi:ATP-dependent protease [Vandammella animalimorsus]|uniref:ATP-dependent protease n=1 Tax=Vandammella animalimorsus TaxID=2029117 RepID=A0A2A2T3W5_9BURK|nr:YifB family Mg chelatase-like AAA ATPase [Vandammella animalimorsus]PAT32348.1 ATP-dependent protease [Vandammella animalimorsus]PAX16256.1 ATP-dependent protease [Vandammella animalimorsus]PAX19705.1 ATP-dependent protease [Vandammella animalimorsus]
MGLAQLQSRALLGLEAPGVTVEVHLANGLPSFTLVGLADVEVREARERVRSAILNSGLEFPSNKRITVNLAPADLPKDSGRFDLPIALGILAASGLLDAQRLAGFAFAGELSLSGALRPVRGALPMVMARPAPAMPSPGADASAAAAVPLQWVLPPGSAEEAVLAPDCTVYRAAHLLDAVAFFRQGGSGPDAAAADSEPGHGLVRLQPGDARHPPPRYPDMADVKGQLAARRALEIAAAGGHHLLMVGPPGAGKSMLAQRLAGLLPPLTPADALQSAAMASLTGPLRWEQWGVRPVRSPHHTASAVALVGGGSPPKPGEISLAHQGVLFLDELPEFPRAALEALREPLETGTIHIARAGRHAQFPARFQLIAAMNPCPCGHWGSTVRACRCTPEQVARYQGRLSGPLLDRIDLHIEVQALPVQELMQAGGGEPSATIQQRVVRAVQYAQARQGHTNQALEGKALQQHAPLSDAARQLLQAAAQQMQWSARAMHRVLRVARTIADLQQANQAEPNAPTPSPIEPAHVAEAVQYRRALLTQKD